MLDTLRLSIMGFPEKGPNKYNTPGSLTAAIAVGMFFNPQRLTPPQVGELAAQIVCLTHGDPTAFLSAAVLAYAITGILMEPQLSLEEQFTAAISAMRYQYRSKYAEADTVAQVLQTAVTRAKAAEPMGQVMEQLQCYSAMNCLAGAFYASLANQDDFDTAMITAVNHSGYSSAVAGITGAILGAKMGYHALPDFYLESLEPVKALCQLADDMVSFTPTKGVFDDDWDTKYVQGQPLL
jgi:ADP-ribosylglycohydrolase